MHAQPTNRFSAGSLVQANSVNGVAIFTGYDLKPGEARTCRVTIANPGATSVRVRLAEADATSDFEAGIMTLTIQEMGHGSSVAVYQGDIGGVPGDFIEALPWGGLLARALSNPGGGVPVVARYQSRIGVGWQRFPEQRRS